MIINQEFVNKVSKEVGRPVSKMEVLVAVFQYCTGLSKEECEAEILKRINK